MNVQPRLSNFNPTDGRGHNLLPGDQAMTSYSGRPRIVRIVERRTGTASPSGIQYRVVTPLARKSRSGEVGPLVWYDASWFTPMLGRRRDDPKPEARP